MSFQNYSCQDWLNWTRNYTNFEYKISCRLTNSFELYTNKLNFVGCFPLKSQREQCSLFHKRTAFEFSASILEIPLIFKSKFSYSMNILLASCTHLAFCSQWRTYRTNWKNEIDDRKKKKKKKETNIWALNDLGCSKDLKFTLDQWWILKTYFPLSCPRCLYHHMESPHLCADCTRACLPQTGLGRLLSSRLRSRLL